MAKLKIIETCDGSHTILNEEMDETYHSAHGALTESKHVFVQEGLEHFLVNQPRAAVLEVGFGTGLNAILTYEKAHELKKDVLYVTLEPFPIEQTLIDQMNYGNLLGDDELLDYFEYLHHWEWNKVKQIGEHFIFQKLQVKLEDYFPKELFFDVIYFDAFAPKKQPDMWSVAQFKHCFALLKPGGILVTYCAQGQFKRDLKEAGFEVERVAGPVGGKREMTRARRPNQ
ncbi:MAG: tRNA (5-methylaminomethyl-2-thiouridine)(34)-methyltransferase MnmD [Flammeovirgaceae bacterium]